MTATAQIPQNVGFSATSGRVNTKVVLNIGLNNNPRDIDTIIQMIGLYTDVDSHKVVNSEYNGEVEPTLVVVGLTDVSQYVFDVFVKVLTGVLTQECIAYKFGGKGVLTYNDEFEGERFVFDEQYFVS